MLRFHTFVFSPFAENTYVLWDETGQCAIVDPGCYDTSERSKLRTFIEKEGLTPQLLLNTHCHLDHIFGNQFVKDTWQIPFCTHEIEIENIKYSELAAKLYGVNLIPSPQPDQLLVEGDSVKIGNTELEVQFVPGHAAGHIAFFQRAQGLLFSGDVLFQNSIGRTDLPGGSLEVLMTSIYEKVLPLGDSVQVMSGHGLVTTVGQERQANPYILQFKGQFT